MGGVQKRSRFIFIINIKENLLSPHPVHLAGEVQIIIPGSLSILRLVVLRQIPPATPELITG